MTESLGGLVCSPEILTEDGVFAVGANGANAFSKNGGKLLVIDPISLGIIDQLGTYPEAKNLKISPDSQYVCFFDTVPSHCLKIIHIENKTVVSVDLDSPFAMHHITWSSDSKFIVFVSELGVYLGVYEVGGNNFILDSCSFDDHDLPLFCFNPSVDYLSLMKQSSIVTYSTDTWTVHSEMKCIINPIGLLFTDAYSLAVWNSGGGFVVYSLIGEELFNRKTSVSSRVKAVTLCRQNRALALTTYNDKVEIYDVLSWDLLYNFDYPCTFQEKNCVIQIEPSSPLVFQGKNYMHQSFQPRSILSLKPLKNICDEFKLKTEGKYYLKFSSNNEFLASYTPGFEKTIWVRDFKTGNVCGVLKLDASSVQGFKWHPEKEILAVITLDSVIIWTRHKTFAVYCRCVLKSFHWIRAKLTICSISMETGGVFLYIGNG